MNSYFDRSEREGRHRVLLSNINAEFFFAEPVAVPNRCNNHKFDRLVPAEFGLKSYRRISSKTVHPPCVDIFVSNLFNLSIALTARKSYILGNQSCCVLFVKFFEGVVFM